MHHHHHPLLLLLLIPITFTNTLIPSVDAAVVSGTGTWRVKSGETGSLCIHSLLLPDNKLVCVERPHQSPYNILNEKTGGWTSSLVDLSRDQITFTSLKDLTTNPFCAGHAQAADGSIWVIGGDKQNSSNPDIGFDLKDGIEGRRKLVPSTEKDGLPKWENEDVHGNMSGGARWYPTVVTMHDEKLVIFSGTTTNLDFENLGKNMNPTYEYYPPRKTGENSQILELFVWAYPHVLYPVSFQLPSKKIFLMVSNRTVLIDHDEEKEKDDIVEIDQLLAEDHEPWIYPNTPTGVLLPMSEENGYKAVVMVCGGVQKGGGLSSNQCYSIEADTPGAKWTREPDMPRGRVMPDSVLLPDGTILFTNGARWGVAGGNAGQAQYCAGPWFDTDIYNPVTRTWSTIGRSVVPRLYHSGAILLQDGSVITTGSEMQNYQDLWGDVEGNIERPLQPLKPECYPNKYENGTEAMACAWPYEMRIEFFSHPYLTASTRPEILSSPLTATYNSTILVTLSPTVPIASLSLIRYTTTTHSTNTDQRLLLPKLLFNNGTHAVFRVPPHGGVAPPGNYHLFVVTGDGVPSVGRRLMIRAGERTEVEMPTTTGTGPAATRTNTVSVVQTTAKSGADVTAEKIFAVTACVVVAVAAMLW